MEDQTAISRMKQGYLDGLEMLVSRYQERALYAAYVILQDRSLSEEIVQNAFLKVYEKIHQFKNGRPFAPWFFRIVVNDAIKMAKNQSRLSSLEEEPDEDSRALARWMIDPHPLPEEQIEIKERDEILQKALAQLSPEQRSTVVMRYYLGLNETEMALKLNRPLSTIKWWSRAARKRLNTLIKPAMKLKGRE